MGKSASYLQKAVGLSNPDQTTNYINPDVVRREPIIFGFKNLDLDKGKFACSNGQGASLIYILNTLRLFSGVERCNLEISFPKCHSVPDEQIKKHNLSDLVSKSPKGKLHQLGRNNTPERIVGYFDSPHLNLFQVCFLDLKHELSG